MTDAGHIEDELGWYAPSHRHPSDRGPLIMAMHHSERVARAAKVLIGLRAEIDQIEAKLAANDPDLDALSREAEGALENVAMLADVLGGREYTTAGKGSAPKSTTRKVRKALGYTYP